MTFNRRTTTPPPPVSSQVSAAAVAGPAVAAAAAPATAPGRRVMNVSRWLQSSQRFSLNDDGALAALRPNGLTEKQVLGMYGYSNTAFTIITSNYETLQELHGTHYDVNKDFGQGVTPLSLCFQVIGVSSGKTGSLFWCAPFFAKKSKNVHLFLKLTPTF